MKVFFKQLSYFIILTLLSVFASPRLQAQTVIGAGTPDPSAMLDVQSTSKGFLPPRMTSAERSAIQNPATGLIVLNTTLNCMEVNIGTPAQPTWSCLGVLSTVSAASATPTVCANTAMTAITHTTTGATGIGTPTGLPAGVTASWASNTITISGTPTAAGTFNYSVPLTGGVGNIEATGMIVVSGVISASSASSMPTLCVNTALTAITHTTTGATGIGTPTGLPAGVTASWASNTITISGTPTASGAFNYSIPLTGGCGSNNAAGTITVNPSATAGSASSMPTLCVNTALTAITHTTTGATGIGTPTNLPAGVTASWASNTITISGTPTASGAFSYSIPLTGGCGSNNAAGTITVSPSATAGSASSSPTLCTSTALTAITHTTTGATSIGTPTGLPAGVTASWASNTITISGTPTASGTFNYTIPVNGCGSGVNATGTIITTATLTGCQVCGTGRILTFSCYNLGAVASTNPYTPRWELNGNYYQWGRAVVAASGPSGSSSTQANSGVVASWNTASAPNGAWTNASKTANDPCPTGFRVPTLAQWQAVLNTSLNPTRSLVGAWTDSNTYYGSGLRIGSGSVGLFLPAAGIRDELDGRLNYRGSDGNYWSSTENGTSANYMYFTSDGPNTNFNPRRLGMSVRCIAE